MSVDAWFDRFLAADARVQELAAIREEKRRADETDRKRCGNCTKWMKFRICPQERNVNGWTHGPSMNHPGCPEFELEPRVARLKQERLADVEARLNRIQGAGI